MPPSKTQKPSSSSTSHPPKHLTIPNPTPPNTPPFKSVLPNHPQHAVGSVPIYTCTHQHTPNQRLPVSLSPPFPASSLPITVAHPCNKCHLEFTRLLENKVEARFREAFEEYENKIARARKMLWKEYDKDVAAAKDNCIAARTAAKKMMVVEVDQVWAAYFRVWGDVAVPGKPSERGPPLAWLEAK